MKTIPAPFHSQQYRDIKIMASAGANGATKDGPAMVLAENSPKLHPDID